MKIFSPFLLLLAFTTLITACDDRDIEWGEAVELANDPSELEPKEPKTIPACLRTLYIDPLQSVIISANCKKANSTQLAQVNQGNSKKDQFLTQCYEETNNSCWCDQLIRPNPESVDFFSCTYGENQVHQLVHPDEDTWPHAFTAVKIIEELQQKNILTRIIYNWWRPEPYNKNVSGSPKRHPFGTSIDVRFETKEMQDLAFQELCTMREDGRLRAIGYYSTTAIHLGIGDSRANTWGKSCPKKIRLQLSKKNSHLKRDLSSQ